MIYDHPLLERLYRTSPPFVQNLFVTGYGALKVFERWTPTFRDYLRELTETQWWSSGQLTELQNQRLRRLIRHCYDTVPYYRRIFDERGLTPNDITVAEDLYKLPSLTKEDVRRYQEALRSRSVPDRATTTGRTGGTSGIPLYFTLDRARVTFDHALVYRHWSWAGWTPRDWVVVLRGVTLVDANYRGSKFWRKDYADRRIYLSAFHMAQDTMSRYVEALNSWRLQFIAAYPSSLFALARHLEQHNTSVPVAAVFTGSESITPTERSTIERRSRAETLDSLVRRTVHVDAASRSWVRSLVVVTTSSSRRTVA